MAAALVDHGRLHSIEPKPENVEDFQNFPGEGVFGKIDMQDIYIGNWRIGSRAGCATGKSNVFLGSILIVYTFQWLIFLSLFYMFLVSRIS